MVCDVLGRISYILEMNRKVYVTNHRVYWVSSKFFKLQINKQINVWTWIAHLEAEIWSGHYGTWLVQYLRYTKLIFSSVLFLGIFYGAVRYALALVLAMIYIASQGIAYGESDQNVVRLLAYSCIVPVRNYQSSKMF